MLVVAAPAPPKPTKTREFATRQETAAKRHNLGPVLGLDARSEGKCDGNDCRGFGKKGYGQFLGTAMAAAWFEVLMLLPEDRVIDEEKEHYPRAFSDGEISYET